MKPSFYLPFLYPALIVLIFGAVLVVYGWMEGVNPFALPMIYVIAGTVGGLFGTGQAYNAAFRTYLVRFAVSGCLFWLIAITGLILTGWPSLIWIVAGTVPVGIAMGWINEHFRRRRSSKTSLGAEPDMGRDGGGDTPK